MSKWLVVTNTIDPQRTVSRCSVGILSCIMALQLGACSFALDLGREQCETHRDCNGLTNGEQQATCSGGYCELVAECTESSECGDGEFCNAGVCEPGCADANACLLGQTCEAGECRGEADARWTCLNGRINSTEAEAGLLSAPIQLVVEAQDIGEQPLPGATADLCRGYDFACDNPEATYVADANGESWQACITHMSSRITMAGRCTSYIGT